MVKRQNNSVKDKKGKTEPDAKTINSLRKGLADFLKHNYHSEIAKDGKYLYVQKPWNDESVRFILRPEATLIQVLNSLILPPRFTAIYHRDSKTMEYIHTVLNSDDPCCKREFKFSLSGKSYFCKYGEASQELLVLSRQFRRTGKQTITDHRNLLILREYVRSQSTKYAISEEAFAGMIPISFYVSGFKKFNENEIVDVSKHLNFFMSYYDRASPYIIIHSPETETTETFTQAKLPEIVFPEIITTKPLDPFILDIALTADTTTITRLKFLYYYQILEYLAFYYIDTKTRSELLRIINNPDIQANANSYISKILETLNSGVRQDKEAKLENLVKTVCSPEAVWREIEHNKSFFTAKQEFDGGFAPEPLITIDLSKDHFCGMWHPKTIITLRHIRNALVHGHEKKFSSVITPTKRNDLLIKPWASIVRCIAEQAIIFSNQT